MTPYIGRAQIVVDDEKVYGRYRDPTPEELLLIDEYRERYQQAFGVEPAGSHWIDSVRALVSLLRAGGISISET